MPTDPMILIIIGAGLFCLGVLCALLVGGRRVQQLDVLLRAGHPGRQKELHSPASIKGGILLHFFGQLHNALSQTNGLKSRIRFGALIVLLFIASYFAWIYLAGRFRLC